MKLNVPLIRQGEESFDCGVACLSMILEFHGIKKSIEDIKKNVKVFDYIGTYAPQLGRYLVENGFEVEIVTMNPHLFTRNFNPKNYEELIRYFKYLEDKSEREDRKNSLKFFREFLEAGGKLKVAVPKISDFQEEILENRPIMALITSNFLLGKEAQFNFHFNVITGFDEDSIYANDPLWDHRGGSHKFPIEEYIYALYACAYGDLDNGSIMKIKKK